MKFTHWSCYILHTLRLLYWAFNSSFSLYCGWNEEKHLVMMWNALQFFKMNIYLLNACLNVAYSTFGEETTIIDDGCIYRSWNPGPLLLYKCRWSFHHLLLLIVPGYRTQTKHSVCVIMVNHSQLFLMRTAKSSSFLINKIKPTLDEK